MDAIFRVYSNGLFGMSLSPCSSIYRFFFGPMIEPASAGQYRRRSQCEILYKIITCSRSAINSTLRLLQKTMLERLTRRGHTQRAAKEFRKKQRLLPKQKPLSKTGYKLSAWRTGESAAAPPVADAARRFQRGHARRVAKSSGRNKGSCRSRSLCRKQVVNSALAELRCATSGFEAVLLLFLRPQTVGITGFAASLALG